MKKNNWQLQQAKSRLTELIKCAVNEGPQHITLHGKPTVVVLSEVDFHQLTHANVSFVDFLRNSPLVGLDILFKRDDSTCRDIDL